MIRCKECLFFGSTSGAVLGLCRRYPASQNKHDQDWCGEFKQGDVQAKPVIVKRKYVRKKNASTVA